MDNKMIAKILDLHGIPYYIDGNGNIYADEMIAFEESSYKDLTGYSKQELYEWLGY